MFSDELNSFRGLVSFRSHEKRVWTLRLTTRHLQQWRLRNRDLVLTQGDACYILFCLCIYGVICIVFLVISLYFCLSSYLSIFLSIYPSISMFVYLSVYLFIYLLIFLLSTMYISNYTSIYLCVCLSICLVIHSFIHFFTWMDQLSRLFQPGISAWVKLRKRCQWMWTNYKYTNRWEAAVTFLLYFVTNLEVNKLQLYEKKVWWILISYKWHG